MYPVVQQWRGKVWVARAVKPMKDPSNGKGANDAGAKASPPCTYSRGLLLKLASEKAATPPLQRTPTTTATLTPPTSPEVPVSMMLPQSLASLEAAWHASKAPANGDAAPEQPERAEGAEGAEAQGSTRSRRRGGAKQKIRAEERWAASQKVREQNGERRAANQKEKEQGDVMGNTNHWDAHAWWAGNMPTTVEETVAGVTASQHATTLMLRHIPTQYTRDKLWEHVERIGFQGQLDFLYLPIDFASDQNLGYAFVNLRAPEAAAAFTTTFNDVDANACLPGFDTRKVCKVVPAAVQGWAANMERFRTRGSAKMRAGPEHWHPIFLDGDGKKLPISVVGGAQESRAKGAKPCESLGGGMNKGASEFVPAGHDIADMCYPYSSEAQCAFEAAILYMFSEHLTALQQQIEYYFSPSNLSTDTYLQSLMDAGGWVRIHDIMDFKRLKKLNVDYAGVVTALSSSTLLEMNIDGLKVRVHEHESEPLESIAEETAC